MEIAFDEIALQDIQFWKKSGNIVIQKKIRNLLKVIENEPYSGIGKSEGKWPRRINTEHRIIYSVRESIDNIFCF